MAQQRKDGLVCNIKDKQAQNSQVIILCGGKGTRLKPMTDEIPKALVELNGQPIVEYILNFYKSKGFTRFTLCVGYKGDKIRKYFNNN